MFCSKCGKTIRMEDEVCPNCGAPIGDNRFGGLPYTSAQFTVAPGQPESGKLGRDAVKDYTRTTYTGMADADQDAGDVGSRTTYRPVYEGASAPERVRRDMRAAITPDENEAQAEDEPDPSPAYPPLSGAAREALDELDEELRPDGEIDRSQFRIRPIQSAGRAGISRDVSEYIRKLEDGSGRRASRRRAAYEAEEDERDAYAAQDYADDEDYAEDYADYGGDGDYAEDDGDYAAPRRGGVDLRRLVKVVGAVVVAALLITGGIVGLRYVRGKGSSAPVEGVTESLYTEGIALVKSHTQQDYIDQYVAKYTSDGSLALDTALQADSTAIAALIPAQPAANDATFISALQAIQDNIASAITMDALAVERSGSANDADHDARWQIINNSISQLESATAAAELTGVINAQVITVVSETPEPVATPEPVVYRSLQKGDENNDVYTLQTRLLELGYLKEGVDGAFGSKTATAVKLFQETAGLEATGIADNDTQTRLFADDAPYAPGAATPQPTAEPTPEPAATELPIQPAEAAGSGAAQADPLSADTQI